MGLYTTIVDTQVKCFTETCGLLKRNSKELNDVELDLYQSGGKLDYYTKGHKVPYVTPFYNYGKDFAIFDFRVFNENESPVIIFIRNGIVNKLLSAKKIEEKDMHGIKLWVDNYGDPIRIQRARDILDISKEFYRSECEYASLCEKYDKETGVSDVFAPGFAEKMKTMPEGEAIKKIETASANHKRAFNESLNLFNKKWRFDKDSSIARNVNGFEDIGYLYCALNADHFLEWEKHKALELYVKKSDSIAFAQEVEKYIEWVDTTDLPITREDIINTFDKYMDEPTIKCINDYLESDTYKMYCKFGF